MLCLLPVLAMAQMLDPIHWTQRVKALSDSTAEITLTATIDDGWHLYTQDIPEDGPVATEFNYGESRTIGLTTTKSTVHESYDPNFELTLTYYEGKAVFKQVVAAAEADKIEGYVYFMACNDEMCLAPKKWTFSGKVPALPKAEENAEENADNAPVVDTAQADTLASEDTVETAEVLDPIDTDVDYISTQDTPLWKIFLWGILAGLLAIITPCVWPIIPMTVSFFLKRAERAEKKTGKPAGKKGLMDAILYGLAIILIYVGLGLMVTVIFGASALNSLSTNAIVNLVFFAILVVFALSFFGLFEITLPSSWSTKLDSKSSSTTGFLSIFFMAFTLVIVSFSCTGPIIGTLLVEAAGKSLLAPAIGMLGFALALALPFSLFAMFPGVLKKVPRSGDWMTSFKVVLAFLELALSLKFLSVADMVYHWGILPRWLFIALWIVIFIAMGIYLIVGITKVSNLRKTLRALLICASWAFAAYLVPGLFGAPVKIISAFAPPMPIEGREVFNDYEEGLAYAKQEGKPILLDFTGYGCVNCRKMENYVICNDSVQEHMKNYVIISLYVDDKRDGIGEKNSQIQAEIYHANAQPYYIQLDENGQPISKPYAFSIDPEDFLQWMLY